MEKFLTEKPTITFHRSVYKRYTDMDIEKVSYELNSDIFTFEDRCSVIERMWISNWKNIKNLTIYVEDCVNNECIVLDNINNIGLEFYNKMSYTNEFIMDKNNKERYLLIPHHCTVLNLMLFKQSAKRLKIRIEKFNNEVSNVLTCKYMNIISKHEQTAMINIPWQSLFLSVFTDNIDIKSGNNNYKIPYSDVAIQYIIICIDNMKNNVEIQYEKEDENYNVQLTECNDDPEFFMFNKEGYSVYFYNKSLNQFSGLHSNSISGHIIMKNGYINIETEEDANVTILYSLLDLCYHYQNNFAIFS
jgi:hypothetical protein